MSCGRPGFLFAPGEFRSGCWLPSVLCVPILVCPFSGWPRVFFPFLCPFEKPFALILPLFDFSLAWVSTLFFGSAAFCLWFPWLGAGVALAGLPGCFRDSLHPLSWSFFSLLDWWIILLPDLLRPPKRLHSYRFFPPPLSMDRPLSFVAEVSGRLAFFLFL